MQRHPWSSIRTLGELSAACQSYRKPELVEDIILTLVFYHRSLNPMKTIGAKLDDGVKLGELSWALWHRPFDKLLLDDERERHCRHTLNGILNSADFITQPKIDGPVLDVRTRFNLHTSEVLVDLYTDRSITAVSDYLLLLLPPPLDAFSALINFLTVNGDTRSKKEAFNAVHSQFPDYTNYAFERDWVPARQAVGLPPRADPGRKRKQKS